MNGGTGMGGSVGWFATRGRGQRQMWWLLWNEFIFVVGCPYLMITHGGVRSVRDTRFPISFMQSNYLACHCLVSMIIVITSVLLFSWFLRFTSTTGKRRQFVWFGYKYENVKLQWLAAQCVLSYCPVSTSFRYEICHSSITC